MPQDYSAYNTIFDVLVNPGAIKKRQKQKGEPNKFNIPPLSALGEGLGEMLANPSLYPVEEVMGSINDELDAAGFEVELVRKGDIMRMPGSGKDWILGNQSFQDGKGVKFGMGLGSVSAFLGNPRGFADSIAKKFEGARKEARWGRFAKGIDQASVFLWSVSNGVDVGTSVRAARAIGSGSSSFMGRQKAERGALESAVEGLRSKYGIDRKTLDRIIGQSFSIGGDDATDKQRRLDFIKNEIKRAGVLSGPNIDDKAEDIAQRIYGERSEDKDFGILTGAERHGTGDQFQALRKSLQFELQEKLRKAQAAGDTSQARKIQRLMVLVNRRAAGQFNRGLVGNLGLVVGKVGNVYNWAKWQSGGKFLSTLVTGDMFYDPKFQWGILNDKKLNLVDSSGNPILGPNGKPSKIPTTIQNSLPQSQMLYILKYIHPVNFLRSTIWDGSMWLELAKRSAGGGAINADSFFYKLWGMMPKRAFEKVQALLMKQVVEKIQNRVRVALAKGVKKLFGKYIRKTAAQLAKLGIREIIKEALIGVVTAVFGIGTGGAGLVVGVALFALDIIGGWLVKKLIRPLLELLSIFVIGALLFVVVGVSSVVGLFTSDDMTELSLPHLDPAVQVSDAEPVGTSSPIPGGSGMYSGTYSGSADQIMASVTAEMGVNVNLVQLDCAGADCGGTWCTRICGSQGSSCSCPSGAWCYSADNIYCRGSALASSSDEYLTRLFRHEVAHQIQSGNSSTWPSWGSSERSNVTEWGAEHISGNGGSYCFSTVGGYMSGTSVTQALVSQGCSSSLIDRAAVADYNALIELESTCGVSPRTYIISRTIGGSCN